MLGIDPDQILKVPIKELNGTVRKRTVGHVVRVSMSYISQYSRNSLLNMAGSLSEYKIFTLNGVWMWSLNARRILFVSLLLDGIITE